MTVETVSQRIKTFILEKFPLAMKRGLQNDEKLLEKGILDSMGVLEVVEFLEQEFDISISDEDLLPENFQSIDCLTEFVKQRQA
jgi:acyl carrier protein